MRLHIFLFNLFFVPFLVHAAAGDAIEIFFQNSSTWHTGTISIKRGQTVVVEKPVPAGSKVIDLGFAQPGDDIEYQMAGSMFTYSPVTIPWQELHALLSPQVLILFSIATVSRSIYTTLSAYNQEPIPVASEAQSSKIGLKVYNRSSTPVAAAIYYKNPLTGYSTRSSEVRIIEPNRSGRILHPNLSLGSTRHVYFSQDPNELTETLSIQTKPTVYTAAIGSGILTSTYYIAPYQKGLAAYNPLTFKLLMLKESYDDFYDTELLQALEESLASPTHTHDTHVAQVRIGEHLSDDEINIVQQRKRINKTALERLLNRPIDHAPTIALVNSGGGARAYICSLGVHIGAEKTGLLDCITYDVGLSGGSWFIGTWLKSRQTPSLFKEAIKPIMAQPILPSEGKLFKSEIQNILNGVMVRKAVGQPTTLVTLWGSILANRYLSPYAPFSQNVLFSSFTDYINQGQAPFPIFTAIDGRFADLGYDFEKAFWYECSPLEMGGSGSWLGHAHVPMWAVGRTFAENQSIDTKPEYDLGQLMGICGSAFAATMGRAFGESLGKMSMPMHFSLMRALGEQSMSGQRVSVGKIPNFTKDVQGSAMQSFDELYAIDGGQAFNIPVAAVLHPKRKADILIVIDSGHKRIGTALETAEKYAKTNNLPFPEINYEGMHSRALSIFESSDPTVPTIVYIARTVDRQNITYPSLIHEKYTTQINTLKFQYTPEELDHLALVTETNIAQSIEQIKAAITRKIEILSARP